MAHAIESFEGHHCAACAARQGSHEEPSRGPLARGREALLGWLARLNDTPIADIGRADYGSIRRLAEA